MRKVFLVALAILLSSSAGFAADKESEYEFGKEIIRMLLQPETMEIKEKVKKAYWIAKEDEAMVVVFGIFGLQYEIGMKPFPSSVYIPYFRVIYEKEKPIFDKDGNELDFLSYVLKRLSEHIPTDAHIEKYAPIIEVIMEYQTDLRDQDDVDQGK